jgi:hypothetical protein
MDASKKLNLSSPVSPEYKIQDAHLGPSLMLGCAGFRKEPSSSKPQVRRKIAGKSEQVFLSYFTETKAGHTYVPGGHLGF